MKPDLILRGGRVIDPAAGTDEIRDVYILGGKIADPDTVSIQYQPEHILDVSGLIVTPGLIDYHAHVFCPGSNIAIPPDRLLEQGTTTVVDAGTAGYENYDAFENSVIANSSVRVRSFLNLYKDGQADASILENFDPALYDREKKAALIRRFPDHIQGLKLRLSRGIVPEDKGELYLKSCIELADELEQETGKHLRVCVHTTNPPLPSGLLASYLRAGDIFCHCYQGAGNTIFGEDSSIDPLILSARERGVVFDAANGRANFSFSVAKNALAAGFMPDIISSDLTASTFMVPPHVTSLPHVLSKYLALGLTLEQVLRCCTQAPARLLGLENEIGSLQFGFRADIAVFALEKHSWQQKDHRGDSLSCDQLLIPKMTFLDGKMVFCQAE